MKKIEIDSAKLTEGVKNMKTTGDSSILHIPKDGGGIFLPELIACEERYFVLTLCGLTDHCLTLTFWVHRKKQCRNQEPFGIRFGIMPEIPAKICFDLNWLDGHVLFPEHNPGHMKMVCLGERIEKNEIDHITLMTNPCFHDIDLQISDLFLTNERETDFPLPDIKRIDKFGQYTEKEWSTKIKNEKDLQFRLTSAAETLPDTFAISGWNKYGGCTDLKLANASGFFSKIKKDGKWWLTDPEGCAFFSVGPDCVVARSDCRIDGVENLLEWLPDPTDEIYEKMFVNQNWPEADPQKRRDCTLFSYEKANLYRVFENKWEEKWASLIVRQLKNNGLNTLGNWSDRNLFGKVNLPYVNMLSRFPTTQNMIYRDFPDVFSTEYEKDALACAQDLSLYKDDPYMIGYFLRNEPSWAFVDNLIIADEVLYNPIPTICKEKLIVFLQQKYLTCENLSKAWCKNFISFSDLEIPIRKASALSSEAEEDMRIFSQKMMSAYVSIPSEACRKTAPNHMNLGMRWAWISDPMLITGWENFDVFSINCYAVDPTSALDRVRELGVDLPVMIGEFHHGALDSGLTATGLEGVKTQKDRGLAYRYYCEKVAVHPSGVGCHYFQCYDQFALGRFDGENYNIGFFDICSQPHIEMMNEVKKCSDSIYKIASGSLTPTKIKGESIPMIAY